MAGLPRMLRDLIRVQLEAEPGVVVAAESGVVAALPELLSDGRADVLVLGVTSEPSWRAVCETLALRERLRMLTVGEGGRVLRVYALRARPVEGSIASLITAIREESGE